MMTTDQDTYLGNLDTPLLTHEEECSLATTAQTSDDPQEAERARKKMVEANIRLVIYVAKKYRRRAQRLGVDFNSLIQEGCIGLMRAVESFDVSKDFRFSTYAIHWIRQAIGRSLQNKAATIRVPVHMQEAISRIRRAASLMEKMNGEKPTPAELASFLELPQDKVAQAFQYIQPTVSLDKPVGDEDSETTLGDFIEDDSSPEDSYYEEASRKLVKTVLRTLTPKEEKVLKLRFGF